MKRILLFVLIASVLIGCNHYGIRGNGEVVSENRDVETFSKISAGGIFNIEVEVGRSQLVKVVAEENLMEYIETYVLNGRLHIETRKSLKPRKDLKLFISVEELDEIDLSGASKLNATNINSNSFKADLSGASKVKVTGKANNVSVDCSGASKFYGEELLAESVTIDASGASKIAIHSDDSIVANASGASKISWSGNATKVRANTSGASSVSRND